MDILFECFGEHSLVLHKSYPETNSIVTSSCPRHNYLPTIRAFVEEEELDQRVLFLPRHMPNISAKIYYWDETPNPQPR